MAHLAGAGAEDLDARALGESEEPFRRHDDPHVQSRVQPLVDPAAHEQRQDEDYDAHQHEGADDLARIAVQK